MPEQKDTVFKFAPLTRYSLKQRLSIRLADIAFSFSIKILGVLTRFEVQGSEYLDEIIAADKLPIYTLWHNRVILSTYFFRDRGIVVLTSQSFDGEYIARTLQRFGCGAIRGSSSRGGARALVEMIKSMRNRHPMAFTVDGPRGPQYQAKPGPVILAKKTGNPILPFLIEPKKYWSVNSWDKMQIPRPFAPALTIIGKPIYVNPTADAAEIEAKLAELQSSLDDLVDRGRRWREKAGGD
jgi:lysophospholipid acyltransferase (LPLAT)-like uncharacterized protein